MQIIMKFLRILLFLSFYLISKEPDGKVMFAIPFKA
jgi:hypothetical protein